ncbi:MAG: carbonic anhydrase [Coriobacteriia bacterium]|nr:carbonic anhydrase [Coriobacteriia bacterium]
MNLHSPDVQVTDSSLALAYLKEGNARFVADEPMARNTNKADLALTKDAQKPFAAILTCADSRTTPEIIFDQKIGDLFVLRNAGNVADQSVLGSLEFGVKHLGVAVVVVMGHTKCGAVYTSHSGADGLSENLQAVLDGIRPNIAGTETEEDGTIANIKHQVEVLKANPEIGAVPVVGCNYDIATGEVTWL